MGIEPLPSSTWISAKSDSGGAKSGAPEGKNPVLDPTLSALVNAWGDLPEAIKTAIQTLVNAGKSSSLIGQTAHHQI
jgi:hypothetical protein